MVLDNKNPPNNNAPADRFNPLNIEHQILPPPLAFDRQPSVHGDEHLENIPHNPNVLVRDAGLQDDEDLENIPEQSYREYIINMRNWMIENGMEHRLHLIPDPANIDVNAQYPEILPHPFIGMFRFG